MARKLVPLEEAAQQLGVSPDELNEMRQRQEIYGYRDGSSWKFKPEDVEKLAEERSIRAASDSGSVNLATRGEEAGDDDGDDMVLLSEVELGESGPSTSSTVIGKPGQGQAAADSDIKLATSPSVQPGQDSDVLPIDLSGNVPLDLGSEMDLSSGPGSGSGSGSGSSASLESDEVFAGQESDEESTVQLGGSPDEEVLGGSGAGSDITISPGDSGISLVDPADSGLSLEEPLELSTSDESSFELSTGSSSSGGSSGAVGESSDFDSDAVMELKGEDDFLLTPLEEAGDEESQDSGSQVIALDSEAEFSDVSPTVVAGAAPGMLEAEDLGPQIDPLTAAALGAAGPALAPGTTVFVTPSAQAQYSVGWVIGLTCCVLVLSLTGMMMFDLVRNVWSWDSAYPGNSLIMDTLLGS
jgi:excisionase family DNA binding protein